MKLFLIFVAFQHTFALNQYGTDQLHALYSGDSCSSAVQVEVIGAGIPNSNGVYDSKEPSYGGTTAGCFDWVDSSKPYYVLNRTQGCSQEGLVDMYFSSSYLLWKISRNGVEIYEAPTISGPWTQSSGNTAVPPAHVVCYGQCDFPSLNWKVIYFLNARKSNYHFPRRERVSI